MIAVTFALPVESSAFVRSLRDRKRGDFITHGTIAEKEIAVVHTGVGSQKCAERFIKFLGQNEPEIVISSGFCGGTNDELKPGDLVIVKNFSNSHLAERAGKLLARAVTGDIFSADRVIDPAADRYAIMVRSPSTWRRRRSRACAQNPPFQCWVYAQSAIRQQHHFQRPPRCCLISRCSAPSSPAC
jgi:hypothetical protein